MAYGIRKDMMVATVYRSNEKEGARDDMHTQ